MTLDLRQESGREVFLRLVDVSHVLVENNAPVTLARLGIDQDTLVARNDRFIVMRMPSMGLDGPHSGFIGMGNSFEALAGLKTFRGFPGTSPAQSPTSLHMDAASGTTGAFAVLMAIRRLRRQGRGGVVELSQLENLIQHIGEIVVAASAVPRSVHRAIATSATRRKASIHVQASTVGWRSRSGRTPNGGPFAGRWGIPDGRTIRGTRRSAGRRAAQDELDVCISAWTAGPGPVRGLPPLPGGGRAGGAGDR